MVLWGYSEVRSLRVPPIQKVRWDRVARCKSNMVRLVDKASIAFYAVLVLSRQRSLHLAPDRLDNGPLSFLPGGRGQDRLAAHGVVLPFGSGPGAEGHGPPVSGPVLE